MRANLSDHDHADGIFFQVNVLLPITPEIKYTTAIDKTFHDVGKRMWRITRNMCEVQCVDLERSIGL